MVEHGYKVELHVHTRFSHDSILPLWLLYLLCRLRKIDCIAITDHNEIKGALLFQQRYPKIKVIVGEEIFSSEGEIIGLFLHERVESNMTARETIEKIFEQDGLVYIPHPVDTKRYKTVLQYRALISNLDKIHCIEKFNGRTVLKKDVNQQSKIASATKLPSCVGGDAHTFYEIGRNYNIFKNPVNTKQDFLAQLPQANYQTSDCLPIAHQSTKFARAIKLIRAGKIRKVMQKIFMQ